MKNVPQKRVSMTPYPELRETLDTFVDEITTELAENLIGIYLVGSLATGDFDLDSDVDFLVVVKNDLTETNVQNLQNIQVKMHDIDCYPAKHLEGSYISNNDLNDWNTVGVKELYYFDNGSTKIEKSVHDNNWHVRWVLRECGITLFGQDPKTLLTPIPENELVEEMKAYLSRNMKLFEESINGPLNFFNSIFGQSFAVLTHCRIMHTIHIGSVQSKKEGALWAKSYVDPNWIDLIDRAWSDREGVRFGEKIFQRADRKLLDETLEFMNYLVEKSGL
jgi:predicted nucleotidyltransferase